MRKNWLTTITAGVCVAGVAAASAFASPAGMTLSNRSPVKSPARQGITRNGFVSRESAASRPSAEISPVRHPVKYLATAVSGLPRPWKSKKGTSNAVAPPAASQKDSISLQTPAGPPTPQLMVSMAQICERQGEIFQARRHYQQALTMWPGQVDVLRAAARMEDRQGELRLAETLYRQAVSANPQHAGALNDLGLCLARQGQLEPSIQVIEQAIQLQPEKALYRNNAATVLVEMRQDQLALAHLTAVHGSAEANYNLGQLLVQRGRAADAAAYFQAALQQNPELQAAQIALAQLQGQNIGPGAVTTAAPPARSDAAVPAAGQQLAPQGGPQLDYPATARSPEFDASGYAPPAYRQPWGALPPTNDPRFSARSPYPHTIPNQPAGVRR